MAERAAFFAEVNKSGTSSGALTGDAARDYMIQQGGGA